MEKLLGEPGAVLIKTYCFESGLWYLAESLGNILEKQGHKVFYIPKSKYSLVGNSFNRTYPKPIHEDDFKKYSILPMDGDKSIDSQILKHVVKYDIKYLISFETLMEKANWIMGLKNRFQKKLQIIDVPMAEWVSENYLTSYSYKLFDEIWALNDLSAKIFSDYKNIKRISWDPVDHSLFNPSLKETEDSINFLHLASTNPDYSSKNTGMVIKEFSRFITDNHIENCKLHIRGAIPSDCAIYLEKHAGNIISNNEIISRQDLANLYKKTDCLVAPSSREGLSLALYEGLASGCKVITTDMEPMNYLQTPYLCKIKHKKKDKSLVQLALVDESSLYKNIKKAYEDINEDRNRGNV